MTNKEPVVLETVSEERLLVDYLWQELCELPDRTSPEEYPGMAMVTLPELTAIVETYFERLAPTRLASILELEAALNAILAVSERHSTPTFNTITDAARLAIAAWNRRSPVLASRLAIQAPDGWQGIESAPFSGPLAGHWSTDEGAEMANRYSAKSRDQLAYGQKTDLELANAVFMAGRGSLELIGLQTAAKERIRWLSVQLALLKRALPAAPNLGATK